MYSTTVFFRVKFHFRFQLHSVNECQGDIRKFMAAHICMYIYNVTNLRSLDFPNPRLIQSRLQSSMPAVGGANQVSGPKLISFSYFNFERR